MITPDEIYLFEYNEEEVIWSSQNDAYDPSDAVKYIKFVETYHLKSKITNLEDKLNQTNERIAELESHCELLRDELKKPYQMQNPKVVRETPKQSLNNIKADAIDEVADWIYDSEENMNNEYTGACDMMYSFSEQLRELPND